MYRVYCVAQTKKIKNKKIKVLKLTQQMKFKVVNPLSVVRDDSKLLDDGGEIPESQGRGWQFDSRL